MGTMGKFSLKPVAPRESGEEPPLAKRLLWFIGIAICGVVVVGTVAYGLRSLLFI